MQVVIFATNKKDAIAHCLKEYGEGYKFIRLYRHVSKGNNFYLFEN